MLETDKIRANLGMKLEGISHALLQQYQDKTKSSVTLLVSNTINKRKFHSKKENVNSEEKNKGKENRKRRKGKLL